MKIIKSILFIVLLFTASVAWATQVKDITDCGANGTDQLDDRAAIQEAIDSLEISGGIVYFPPGIFKVSDTIYVPSNIKLQGTGSTQYNTHIQLMQPQRALFEVTNKGANNIVFKDLFLVSMVRDVFPRTNKVETAFMRTEGTIAISFKARNIGLSNIVVENVRAAQFNYGISATALSGLSSQITDVKIRNYVSDGNEYALHSNTFGADDWDIQNMNVFLMYHKQNGIWLERSGQMRFLQLSCAGATTAETCAKLWGNGDTYFRQMHVEGPPIGICVGNHCRPNDPPGNMGENSSKITVENSATNGEFHRFTNFVAINNRMWLETPANLPPPPGTIPPPPGKYTFITGTTAVNSSLRSCGNVWVSWHPDTHTTLTRVTMDPSDYPIFFPGLATTPITVCSNNDLTSIPSFNTGYDPDDEELDDDRNVMHPDYGATADSVDGSYDYDAFNYVINLAITSRARRVFIPCGRFDIDESLILDRGVTFVGEVGCPPGHPSEIRLHGQGIALFTILNTPINQETIMQGIGFRNLVLTSQDDDGTIGINFENYSPTEVGPASDFHIQNVDFEGFGAGIAVRPYGEVFANPNPMFDSVSIKDGDFTGNKIAIFINSDNASNWNMEDIRVQIPSYGEGVRINRGGHPSLRNLSCNGDVTATACLTIQRQSGTSVDNMTAFDVISALDVPWENGSTQFPVSIRNSNLIEGVYFQGRIYLNSVNNQYPAELESVPVPVDRKVVRFGGFQEGNNGNSAYGGLSDIFSCTDIFIDPLNQQTENRWIYTGVLEKRVTYCN